MTEFVSERLGNAAGRQPRAEKVRGEKDGGPPALASVVGFPEEFKNELMHLFIHFFLAFVFGCC